VLDPVQLVLLTLLTVYVLVVDGLTVNEYGLVVIPVSVTGVVPSVYVKSHGLDPVSETLKLEPPEHKLPPPDSVDFTTQVHVGSKAGLTVNKALPDTVPLQPASETLVRL
jgi:hypothetical protein